MFLIEMAVWWLPLFLDLSGQTQTKHHQTTLRCIVPHDYGMLLPRSTHICTTVFIGCIQVFMLVAAASMAARADQLEHPVASPRFDLHHSAALERLQKPSTCK